MRRPGAVIRVQSEAAAVFSSAWQGSPSLQHVRKSCCRMEVHDQLQHAALSVTQVLLESCHKQQLAAACPACKLGAKANRTFRASGD